MKAHPDNGHKLNFCTVSDSRFLLETTALFISLQNEARKAGKHASLAVLCLDDEAAGTFKKIDPAIETVLLSSLNDPALMATRSSRKPGEFAQTSKASLVCHLLGRMLQDETLIFIDSDTYYYADPSLTLAHGAQWSVLITSHWFSEEKKELAKKVGTYNSGLVAFRNDAVGREYARLWRTQCIEWCYNRIEDGKFTDQFYLETWPEKNRLVQVSKNKGINVGTWDIERFAVEKKNVSGSEQLFVDGELLVCYHFHGLKLYLKNGKIRAYPISVHNTKIYKPYLKDLQSIYEKVHAIDPSLAFRFSPDPGLARVVKQIVFRYWHELLRYTPISKP